MLNGFTKINMDIALKMRILEMIRISETQFVFHTGTGIGNLLIWGCLGGY